MKKWTNIIFCILFLLMLVCPLFSMDLRMNQESEIDNTFLPEITLELIRENGLSVTVEEYVNKRIGYRAEALDIYQKINDHAFGLLVHPYYMYGSNGQVYFSSSDVIARYQHTDLDQENAEEFAKALAGFQAYANSKGMDFLYWFIPDKETVYPENYPANINSYGDVSYNDQILMALEKHGVQHLYAKEAMLEGKKTVLVNNVKYDAGHWNEHGAFLCCVDLYRKLQQFDPSIRSIAQDNYTVSDVIQTSLQSSYFEINEAVPYYSLVESHAEDRSDWLRENLFFSFPHNYAYHYINSQQADMPKILFFSDSYLESNAKFFIENFSQTTLIHRYNCVNQKAFEYYVDFVDPDIIVFENPERSLPIDLYQNFEKP